MLYMCHYTSVQILLFSSKRDHMKQVSWFWFSSCILSVLINFSLSSVVTGTIGLKLLSFTSACITCILNFRNTQGYLRVSWKTELKEDKCYVVRTIWNACNFFFIRWVLHECFEVPLCQENGNLLNTFKKCLPGHPLTRQWRRLLCMFCSSCPFQAGLPSWHPFSSSQLYHQACLVLLQGSAWKWPLLSHSPYFSLNVKA